MIVQKQLRRELGFWAALTIGAGGRATINLLRIVQPTADVEAEQKAFRVSAETIMMGYDRVQYHVQPGENITEAMTTFIDKEDNDLIIIGASHEWRIRNVLFDSIPDIVADYADCSVLKMRRYLLEH